MFLPASASSLLLAAVAATDVFFASADPGGAAALSFAFLLAMAPMGVASTSLVVSDGNGSVCRAPVRLCADCLRMKLDCE